MCMCISMQLWDPNAIPVGHTSLFCIVNNKLCLNLSSLIYEINLSVSNWHAMQILSMNSISYALYTNMHAYIHTYILASPSLGCAVSLVDTFVTSLPLQVPLCQYPGSIFLSDCSLFCIRSRPLSCRRKHIWLVNDVCCSVIEASYLVFACIRHCTRGLSMVDAHKLCIHGAHTASLHHPSYFDHASFGWRVSFMLWTLNRFLANNAFHLFAMGFYVLVKRFFKATKNAWRTALSLTKASIRTP